MRIATVSIECQRRYPLVKRNTQRFYDLEKILKTTADLYVLPGGYFCSTWEANALYPSLEQGVRRIIGGAAIALGVDGQPQRPWPKDQTAIAINNTGIIAAGRKFAPAPKEKINAAENYLAKEGNYERIFEHQKRFYLGVCYDSFGIRHNALQNPGVDIFLDHIHGFFPSGEGNSGEGYFAKHGLAGASKQWNIPTFGAAIFFNRHIPENWPTGVQWTLGNKSTMYWKYDDNPLKPETTEIDVKEGKFKISCYEL